MHRKFDTPVYAYDDGENPADYTDYPNDYPYLFPAVPAPDQPALPGLDALVEDARDLGGEVLTVTPTGAVVYASAFDAWFSAFSVWAWVAAIETLVLVLMFVATTW